NWVNPSGTTLHFEDQPSDWRLQSNQKLAFMTMLVGVRKDASFDILDTFYWESDYTGAGAGGVRASIQTQVGGTGGITAVSSNVPDALISAAVLSQITSLGGAFPVWVEPSDQRLILGVTQVFNVVASGPAPLTYQWYKSGLIQAGATGSSLNLAGIT